MGTKEDLRIRRTKQYLTEALFKVLSETTIEEVSVSDICRAAMVHRTTFYKHFYDKYDLLGYAIDCVQEEVFNGALQGKKFKSVKDLYMTTIHAALDYVDANKDTLRSIIKNSKVQTLTEFFFGLIKRSVSYLMAKDKSGAKYEYPNIVVQNFFGGGIASLMLWWISKTEETCTKNELLEHIDSIMEYFIDKQPSLTASAEERKNDFFHMGIK